jgi:hypothetical protein
MDCGQLFPIRTTIVIETKPKGDKNISGIVLDFHNMRFYVNLLNLLKLLILDQYEFVK